MFKRSEQAEKFCDLPDEELYKLMLAIRKAYTEHPDALASLVNTGVGQEVRRRAKADLYFFAKYVIGFDKHRNDLMMDATHRRVCDMFVHKNDTKTIQNQDIRKQRLILYPRGSFKSVIDVADAAQWILNFPDIRILFLTGDEPLAEGFLSDTRSIFIKHSEEEPSFMNVFFAEFCIDLGTRESGNVSNFTSPMRRIERKEPTVMAASINSTLSGKHFDVIKADDIVTNRNSENELQCGKVTKQLRLNKKTLMAFGYLDMIGTRYRDYDTWGEIIEKNVGELEKETGPCWEIIRNLSTGLNILIGHAWQAKPESSIKDVNDLIKDDYNLLFPELLTYEFLKGERDQDEFIFEGQYNQNPKSESFQIFSYPLLVSHTVPWSEIPINGPTVVTWDFAFSAKKGRDYSTAAVGRYNQKGQLFIIELIRQRFRPAELAKKVVELARDWHPDIIGIENAGGSNFLGPAIMNEAEKTGQPYVVEICNRIDWFSPEREPNAKKNRIGALHPWLTEDRLFFSSHLPYLDVLYKEFEQCMEAHHHDDIPDVIARQPQYAPRMYNMIQKQEIATWSREEAMWNILFEEGSDEFGRIGGGFSQPQPMTPEPTFSDEVHSDCPPGLDPILGAGFNA